MECWNENPPAGGDEFSAKRYRREVRPPDKSGGLVFTLREAYLKKNQKN